MTGKTASGKTTVCRNLADLLKKSRILDADRIAKNIYCENDSILKDLRINFGDDIFYSNGTVNYGSLADKVFSDESELIKLNKLMFPLINKEIKRIIASSHNKNYIIIDAAVLFGCELHLLCDFIILVRIKKVMQRRFLKKKFPYLKDNDINLRLDGQLLIFKKDFIDFIIDNNGTKEELYKKVRFIAEQVKTKEQ